MLLGGDPVVRSVWVPLFEDVPLHIPLFLFTLHRKDAQFEGVLVVDGDLASLAVERVCSIATVDCVLFGGDPYVQGVWVPRTPSHTVLTLPAFDRGPGSQFEGV